MISIFPNLSPHLLNRGLDVGVVAHVALDGLRVASPIGDQLFDAATHSLVLVSDCKLGAGLMQYVRDGPRDAPVVRDAEHDAGTFRSSQSDTWLRPAVSYGVVFSRAL